MTNVYGNSWQIQEAWNELLKTTAGQGIAEMEIEARKDEHELREFNKNPYEPGSFQALIYTHEITRIKLNAGQER